MPGQEKRRRKKLLGGALTASGAAAAAFGLALWFGGPPGSPVPAGAVRGEGFAYVLPPGWSDQAAAASGRWESVARLSDGEAVIDVLRGPSDLPALSASAQGAFFALVAAFGGREPRLERWSTVEIDGLKAVEILASGAGGPLSPASGALDAKPSPAPAAKPQEFRGRLVIVPAAGRAFVIRAWAERAAFERAEPLFQAFLASFRVLSRPSSFRRLRGRPS